MDRPYDYMLDPEAYWPARDAVDINSKELAAICRVTPTYLSQVTGGKCSPGPELRKAMAEALGVTEDELFMRVPKASKRQPRDRQPRALWKRRRATTPKRVRANTRHRRRARRKVPTGRVYPTVPRAAG